MAEGSSPDVDEKLFLGSLRASRAIKKVEDKDFPYLSEGGKKSEITH